MPFTPYHFGAGGFVGMLLYKWVDIPVLLLANVIVDVEVLFAQGLAPHRHWHWHSLLIGGIVGAMWGITAFAIKPIRRLFERGMKLVRLPYKPNFWKMVLSGVLGVWLHVLVDTVYHYDVQMLWPSKIKPLWKLVHRNYRYNNAVQGWVEIVCVVLFAAAIVAYVFIVYRSGKRKNIGSHLPQ